MSGERLHVVRAGGMGDVLWVEPILRALAGRHDEVILHSRFSGLFRGADPDSLTLRPRLTKPRKAALQLGLAVDPGARLLDLDGAYERQPKMHLLHAYQDAAGLPRTRTLPRLPVHALDPVVAADLPAEFALLHLQEASGRNHRRVHGVDWERVVGHLADRGLPTILVGRDPAPVPGARHIAVGLTDLVALTRRARLFVGIDSGPSHLAACLGVPAVLFFGSVNPDYRHFLEGFRGTVLQQPCVHAGCYHEVVSKDGQPCLLVGDAGVPPCALHETSAVRDAIDGVLAGNPRP